jgi:hypothetical protein
MPVLAAFAFANLKSDLKWLWGVITHASFWQLVTLGLIGWMVVTLFQLADARHDRDAYRSQRDGYKAQLDAISSKRDVQRQVTRDNIKVVTRVIHDADDRARVVETAPVPQGCRTSQQVLDADI